MLKYYVKNRRNPITKDVKFYAMPASPEPLQLEQIAQSISGMCTVTRHDILAVLSAVQEEIIKALQQGQSVRLGDLGSFRLTLHSLGTTSEPEFKVSNITAVHVRFNVNPRIRGALRLTNPDMKFQKVGTPAAPGGGGSGPSLGS